MKKKIIIGMGVFSLVFIIGGIYIISTIETITSRLNRLIMLHQVEILRERLLTQIIRVQSDLGHKDAHHVRSSNDIMTHIRDMSEAVDTCFGCHHSEGILERLTDLKNHIEDYKNALSRSEAEGEKAFRIGEDLITKANSIIATTSNRLEEKTQSAITEIARAKNLLFILIAIGSLLTLVLASVFIRSLTRPVNALLNATKRLKEGDLEYRIEGLKDEFGELALSFNDMAASLKEQINKMQRAEQMVVYGEIAAGLAHELKNPLAGIKASMEVLSEESTLAEEERVILSKAIAEIRRIELLIKDLLNYARPPKPQSMSADVNKILDAVLNMFTFSLKTSSSDSDNSRSIQIVRDFDKNLPPIMVDPAQLQQVVLNILLNAVDAMPDGGTISAKTFSNLSTRHIQIEISDTGKGIDKEVMDKIFQPFFTTKPKGTGLGLAITKRLIEENGGNISFESNLGRGTTFSISLPIKQEGVLVA